MSSLSNRMNNGEMEFQEEHSDCPKTISVSILVMAFAQPMMKVLVPRMNTSMQN